MVPLRFVSEAFGCKVGWSPATQTVTISSPPEADPFAELEKQALAQYKQEKGETTVRAKAEEYGCHVQIDIIDSAGNVVRSYGYRGGPLYIIK
ncbi:MAG: stalk domain-containing protein [Eubacteriales bacterium]